MHLYFYLEDFLSIAHHNAAVQLISAGYGCYLQPVTRADKGSQHQQYKSTNSYTQQGTRENQKQTTMHDIISCKILM